LILDRISTLSLIAAFDKKTALDECPIEPTISFGEALRDRAYWLVGLLLMQSFSGIILSRNEALLADHPVIIFFLTMLVGAGGNAGNQASVRGKLDVIQDTAKSQVM
jgi:Mg/Co/Ni transporter MgtE